MISYLVTTHNEGKCIETLLFQILEYMSDDDEIPNFFNELQKFIRDKYTTDYNVSKSINLKKKNESVRPSMTKDELIETVNKLRNTKKRVIKTIKVKDIKI